MKGFLIISAILLAIVLHINAIKILDSPLSVPYPANRQGNLYDSDLDDLLYQRMLESLGKESQNYRGANDDDYSGEFEDLEPNYFDMKNLESRNLELPSHSAIGEGYQYVQGGAGESEQHLHPDGSQPNVEEIKTDEELPTYCDPPNPCPLGYPSDKGDCDSRPFPEFTAEFSKHFQMSQDCMCDDDHNDCSNHINKKSDKNIQGLDADERFLGVVAKKSPRTKRDTLQFRKSHVKNPYLGGKALRFHVAKKSVAV